MKSTPTRYGTVAVTIHWLSVVLIVMLLASGFRAASMTDPDIKTGLLSIHAPLGMAILILTLARVLWWWFADRKPDPVAGDPAWQRFVARAVHILFYVVIIGMASSGIGMMALSGAGAILFEGSGAALPNFHDFLPRVPHGIGARLMVALLILHAGAALYHQFVKRDGLLTRMWYARGGR